MSRLTALWPKVNVHIDGKDKVVARGGKLPAGIDRFTADTLVQIGAAAYVDEAPAEVAAPEVPTTFEGPPAKSANVATWRAYAKFVGMPAQEADDAQKKDLVEKYATTGD